MYEDGQDAASTTFPRRSSAIIRWTAKLWARPRWSARCQARRDRGLPQRPLHQPGHIAIPGPGRPRPRQHRRPRRCALWYRLPARRGPVPTIKADGEAAGCEKKQAVTCSARDVAAALRRAPLPRWPCSTRSSAAPAPRGSVGAREARPGLRGRLLPTSSTPTPAWSPTSSAPAKTTSRACSTSAPSWHGCTASPSPPGSSPPRRRTSRPSRTLFGSEAAQDARISRATPVGLPIDSASTRCWPRSIAVSVREDLTELAAEVGPDRMSAACVGRDEERGLPRRASRPVAESFGGRMIGARRLGSRGAWKGVCETIEGAGHRAHGEGGSGARPRAGRRARRRRRRRRLHHSRHGSGQRQGLPRPRASAPSSAQQLYDLDAPSPAADASSANCFVAQLPDAAACTCS